MPSANRNTETALRQGSGFKVERKSCRYLFPQSKLRRIHIKLEFPSLLELVADVRKSSRQAQLPNLQVTWFECKLHCLQRPLFYGFKVEVNVKKGAALIVCVFTILKDAINCKLARLSLGS